jgi:basic amino acid/polyamine antiporter, APA family
VNTPGTLQRRLGLADAVVIGLGSMLGTGVFVVWSPAADRAGRWLLLALGVAALVAYCNATSTAQLAAVHPESGGAYVYGRLRLGRWWGTLAGTAFVVGKTASCAAAALTIGLYAWPGHARWIAVVVVLVATAVNLAGITRTAGVTWVLVGIVLAVLAAAVVTALVAYDGPPGVLDESVSTDVGPVGVLAAAAVLFFAFAGYARVATLGAEVRDPARTIPRAVVIALGVVLVVYLVVGLTLLATLGVAGLARTTTPLSAAVDGVAVIEPLVRVGAALAAFAVLLPLLAGVSRTVLAMATYGDLPPALAAVSSRHSVPHRAQSAVGVAVLLVVLTGGLVTAVAVSAGAVLVYYAVANAASLRLTAEERRWPRLLAIVGFLGCVTLAVSLLTEGISM